jgi:hypothetical protein
VCPALATALVASVADPKAFRSGRDFSAWIGLVPKQHSSGGKDKLGGISKQGDRYLRSLFTVGALTVIRYAKIHGTGRRPWLTALLARRPTKVAAIASSLISGRSTFSPSRNKACTRSSKSAQKRLANAGVGCDSKACLTRPGWCSSTKLARIPAWCGYAALPARRAADWLCSAGHWKTITFSMIKASGLVV